MFAIEGVEDRESVVGKIDVDISEVSVISLTEFG